MMHVSPCAWYCFTLDEEDDWKVEDRAEETRLSAPDGSCVIEITAARRVGRADESEIADIHERYLQNEGIQPLKTAVAENPFRISAYVTRGLGIDEREHIVCHAYWRNYCAFLKYRGRREPNASARIQAFYDLVESLQPLAIE
jgi:hypothetical protein